MGDQKTKSISATTRTVMVLINLGLLAVFAWNVKRLFDLHRQIKQAASQPILSANPGEFLAKLESNDVQWWMWAVVVGAIAISLALIASLIIPSLSRYHHRAAVVTSAWFGLWLVYVAAVAVVGLLALNRLFS